MMLGYCIAAWAEVDECLFRVFRNCVGPYDQCAIIYYKTPSLDARFTLTDEIVKSVLPEKKAGEHDHPDLVAWKNTIKGYGELLAVRRRLAHHPTTVRINPRASGLFNASMFNQLQFGGALTAFSWVESHMSDHEKLRGQAGADKPPLRLKDLEDHYAEVGTLANRLLTFLIEVLTRPPAEPSQPKTQPR